MIGLCRNSREQYDLSTTWVSKICRVLFYTCLPNTIRVSSWRPYPLFSNAYKPAAPFVKQLHPLLKAAFELEKRKRVTGARTTPLLTMRASFKIKHVLVAVRSYPLRPVYPFTVLNGGCNRSAVTSFSSSMIRARLRNRVSFS